MNILKRIINLSITRKSVSHDKFGGKLLPELQKHLQTLDDRLEIFAGQKKIVDSELREWRILEQAVREKKKYIEDENKLASLERLHQIAQRMVAEYEMKRDNLQSDKSTAELRERTHSAIAMIEVENSLRDVTSMFADTAGAEHNVFAIEQETREIRRLLYTSESLLELNR
jgi:hypothetical protein